MEQIGKLVADAVLGIDTLWGGDVLCASGTGRFIADSWFSDEPLPAAYTIPPAGRIRQAGGVTGKESNKKDVEEYVAQIDLPGIAKEIRKGGAKIGGLRGSYLVGLAGCVEVMWELALEVLGRGAPVSYERCVEASTGRAPKKSKPEAKRERVGELLRRAGYVFEGENGILSAVDAWRLERLVPMASVRALGNAVIAHYDRLCEKNLAPHLPKEFVGVPRANIEFLPIKDAWFSGSMNYIGRARNKDGSPKYEATYEVNASLKMSVPEFEQLVSHEVVPGHVTTFAYLQNLYVRRLAGFEATVLTMNTRAATLFEGIANNAILIAHGVTSVNQLPDEDLQIGVYLALLQDDAKNQASYLTWNEKMPREEVARILRRPAYRAGTERVAELRRSFPAEKVLPALYGCKGLVDVETVGDAIAAG